MTKIEIIAQVVAASNRSDKTAVIGVGVDLGLSEICSRYSFKQQRVVSEAVISTDEQELDLPADCLQSISIRIKRGDGSETADVAGAVILVVTKDWLMSQQPDLGEGDTTGMPVYAYEENGKLRMVPKANDNYTIELTYDRLEALEDDGDSPNITLISNSLISFACAYLFRSISMFESADRYMMEYERSLQHAILSDNRRPAVHRQMRGAQQMNVGKVKTSEYNENIYTPE